jgi:serine protease 7
MSHHNTNHIMTGRNPAATAVLCCVISIIIQLVHSQQDNGCRTPDNGRGGCVSIYECEELLTILKSSKITPDQSKYLRSAQCKNGVGRMPYVCCREKAQPVVKEPRGEYGGPSLLPEPGICGAEPVGGRIFSGIETGIYEFPWFVLLEYVVGHRKTFACGGTLINQRYVLTAAHCLVGKEGRRKL